MFGNVTAVNTSLNNSMLDQGMFSKEEIERLTSCITIVAGIRTQK